jgi:tripartite-type tricarboxylate transporter receptor subunit TctC
MRLALRSLVALLALTGLTAAGHAQQFPTKPVRLVIGYPPGGGIDFTGRLIADRLSQQLGQPVVVDNKPGAGGQIGADTVAKSRPDGHTLLFAVGSDLTWIQFMTRRKTVDPLSELTPIATAVASVSCMAVNVASPYRTLKDLAAFAGQNPAKLTYGTSGVQTAYYLYGEMLKQNGLNMTHVPYTGTPQILTALLGGEIDVGMVTVAIAKPAAEDGKIRMLGIFDPVRFPGTPDVPAIKEVLPGFNAPVSWFGFFGPAGLPGAIGERLNAEIANAVRSPEIAGKIAAQSQRPMITPYPRMRPFVAETMETFRTLFQTANIQPLD